MFTIILIHFLLSGLIDAQLYEGDSCRLEDNSSGVCKRLKNCQEVYQQIISGKLPTSSCGYISYEPIVCCPLPETITNTISSVTRRSTEESTLTVTDESVNVPMWEKINGRSALSRRKCEEYSKAVYTTVIPPTLAVNRKPVNVSLCSIKSQKLIVGGTKAEPKEFPHMAAVGFNSKSVGIIWLCGGTLVSELFVLSAAHCTYALGMGNAAWIRVGDLILKSDVDDARPQVRRIVKRIRYPDYKKPLEYHDIALLKMERPVKFDAWVRPSCLPSFGEVENVEKAIATGWGRVDWADEDGSDHLLKVTLPIVPHRICNSSFGSAVDYKLNRGIIDEWQICAGEEGRDTCQGDSGGPLTIYDPQFTCMYDVIGVTSLGRLCGSEIPGVYTRVYNYIAWLENTIWPDN
ncbi:hypothetical protein PV325_006121 [Microctonus aethiopoides]|uniref:Uncharacterized protein n=1 Tax=Microctonus aethiopoides TaxID=144406 RepID=A0AA39F181_9HYME|nr:hypothetical protein PV325_006121 [Microctonus aethiopoides]KAK0159148.1 hypothetical protein PV328_010070 [Microctonus aethiopoides]